MSNDNTESISAKLRRVADEKRSPFTFKAACKEFEVAETHGWGDLRSVLSKIADEIDREIDELRESFANPRYVNIEDAVREVAFGIDDHGRTKDAINRYYLPRPLFEDGEPVYIGAEIDDRKRGKLEVSRICYMDGGFYFNNSRGSNGRKMKGITYKHGERVGRPKPQVLDADGVPIEVGDVLWRTTDDMKVVVAELEKGHFVDGDGVGCNPSYFTHREPDTQERIDRDALKDHYEYWGCMGIGCSQCPALVDGKKPKERYGVIFCRDAMHLDLLRRQRELDNREGK